MAQERWPLGQVCYLQSSLVLFLNTRPGTIADLWTHHTRGRASLFFILAPFLGPSLGPLTGAYIIAEYNYNWRFAQWVILFIAAPILVASLFMQETSKQRILYLREKKRGVKIAHKTGDTRILLRKLRIAISRPINMMFREVSSPLSLPIF